MPRKVRAKENVEPSSFPDMCMLRRVISEHGLEIADKIAEQDLKVGPSPQWFSVGLRTLSGIACAGGYLLGEPVRIS